MHLRHLSTMIPIAYFAIFIGIAIALVLSLRRSGWRGVPIVGLTLASGVYGARVWGAIAYGHVALTSGIWWHAASSQYSAHYHHASIVGGILGGGFAVAVFCPLFRLPTIAALGALTPGVAAAQAVGRIQCYVNGCCFGTPTNLPWGVSFPAETYAGFLSGPLPLHPTQLYEAALDVTLSIILLRLVTQSRERYAAAAYLAGYGVIRLFVECFRVGQDAHFLCLSSAQWVSMSLITAGVAIWSKVRRRTDPSPSAAPVA